MKITNFEVIALAVPIEKPIKNPSSIPYASQLSKVLFKEYRTVIVRIYTDGGIVGIGECMVRIAPKAYQAILEYVKPILIGANPFDIELIWDKLYSFMRTRGHYKGFYIEAISAIDIALWDIKGKALNVPVYQLIGGKTKEKVWVYASSLRTRGTDSIVEEAQKYLAQGYNAIKIKIGQDPSEYREDIKVIEALRKCLGNNIYLMVDANCAYQNNIKMALRVGQELGELDVYWFEEPISADNYEGYEYLTQSLNISIAGGECEYTRDGFRQLIMRKAIDIIQPNICGAGGITECKKISALASSFHVPYSVHTGPFSAVCVAASLQFAVADPNCINLEFWVKDWSQYQSNPLRWELAQLPIKSFKDGYVEIEDRPGLGIELNEEILKKYSVQ